MWGELILRQAKARRTQVFCSLEAFSECSVVSFHHILFFSLSSDPLPHYFFRAATTKYQALGDLKNFISSVLETRRSK